MADRRITVEWLDGRIETPYGEPTVRDGVLHITEHFGITGGVKTTTSIPLAGIRKWNDGDRGDYYPSRTDRTTP